MPVLIGSIPTVEDDDIRLVSDIASGKIDVRKSHIYVENEFKEILGKSDIFFFNRGREAIYLALQSLEVSPSDEVLVQAMTCNAVISPILCLGAKPIYVDISKETYNIDTEDLKKKISPATKTLIVQHTFGKFAKMEEIQKICKAKDIKIIEDCAHLFRSDIQKTVVGRFSDISIFSFAQDKAISSVTGGLLVVNNTRYTEKVRALYGMCGNQTIQEAKYPLSYLRLWNFAKKYYFSPLLPFQKRITVGKVAIMISRWLKITKQQASENLEQEILPTKMSDIQYALLQNQLKKLDDLNIHRYKILQIYNPNFKDLLIRYSVFVKNPESLLNSLRKNKYICGRWYSSIVFPMKNLEIVDYIQGSCPVAEKVVKHIVNLPLSIDTTELDAKVIKNIVSKFQYKV